MQSLSLEVNWRAEDGKKYLTRYSGGEGGRRLAVVVRSMLWLGLVWRAGRMGLISDWKQLERASNWGESKVK